MEFVQQQAGAMHSNQPDYHQPLLSVESEIVARNPSPAAVVGLTDLS